jgi:type IV pilus assembly protein PilE
MELMITVAIAAILASIAIPAYNSYVLKSHRTEAKTALLDMASMEERFFTTTNGYSQLTTDLGYSGPWPVTVGSGYYQIQAPAVNPAVAPTGANPAGTPASFTLTAVPVNIQLQDGACTQFQVLSNGTKLAQGSDPNANVDCWN